MYPAFSSIVRKYESKQKISKTNSAQKETELITLHFVSKSNKAWCETLQPARRDYNPNIAGEKCKQM